MSSARSTASSACALVVAALCVGACSSSRCHSLSPGALPALQIQHLSGGEAPTVEVLAFYDDGRVELSHATREAKRPKCATIPSHDLAMLRASLGSSGFHQAGQALAAAGRRCCDMEEAFVKRGDLEFWVATDDAPAEVHQLFSILDRIFLDRFGREYRLRLASN